MTYIRKSLGIPASTPAPNIYRVMESRIHLENRKET